MPLRTPEEDEDPRMPLVEKLLEYQMFTKAGKFLLENSLIAKNMFPVRIYTDDGERGFEHTGVFHLTQSVMDTFHKIKPSFHHVQTENYSVSEKIEELKKMILPGKRISFHLLFKKASKIEGIVTFLALLELARSQTLKVLQEDLLGLIEIMGTGGTPSVIQSGV